MGKVLAVYETPAGDKIQKIEGSDGEVTYHAANQTGKYDKGQFISPDVGESIEQQARQGNQIETVQRTRENRRRIVNERYPKIDETKGLDPKNPQPNAKKENVIRGWMDNAQLRKQIEDDPWLEGQQEKDRALEAKATEIVDSLEGTTSEGERQQILRQYGVDS